MYLKSLEMLPLIAGLRQQAESIRLSELEKTLRSLPDLTDAERARIEALTQALVKKLLEKPTRRLHAEAVHPHAPEYADVSDQLERKIRGIAIYESQLERLFGGEAGCRPVRHGDGYLLVITIRSSERGGFPS